MFGPRELRLQRAVFSFRTNRSLGTRRELIEAIAARYQCGTRIEKQKILDEFIEVTKFHREHAIRALRKVEAKVEITQASRARLYEKRL